MSEPLFHNPPKPRRKPRVLMHVCETADGDTLDDGPQYVRFDCAKCGYETEFVLIQNTTEGVRGIPCPQCNKKGES